MDGNYLYFQHEERQSIEDIFNEYFKRLTYFAQQYMPDEQAAEDVVCDVFLELVKSVTNKKISFRARAQLKTWLYFSCKNRAIDCLRKNKRTREVYADLVATSQEADDNTIEQRITKSEILGVLVKHIEDLPPMRRVIFELFYFYDLPVLHIAAELKITVDTVRVQKARGLHYLKKSVSFSQQEGAKSVFTPLPRTVAAATNIVKRIAETSRKQLPTEIIIKCVAEYFKVPAGEITNKLMGTRRESVMDAAFDLLFKSKIIVARIMRELNNSNNEEIAAVFNYSYRNTRAKIRSVFEMYAERLYDPQALERDYCSVLARCVKLI